MNRGVILVDACDLNISSGTRIRAEASMVTVVGSLRANGSSRLSSLALLKFTVLIADALHEIVELLNLTGKCGGSSCSGANSESKRLEVRGSSRQFLLTLDLGAGCDEGILLIVSQRGDTSMIITGLEGSSILRRERRESSIRSSLAGSNHTTRGVGGLAEHVGKGWHDQDRVGF